MNASAQEMSHFVRFAAVWGKKYLSCGGPQTRLEEFLVRAGSLYGFRTEVYASPAGLMISASAEIDANTVTRLEKVQESSIRLAELKRLERFLESVIASKSDLRLAAEEVEFRTCHQMPEYPYWMVSLSIVVLGFSSSLSTYGYLRAALGSGLITGVTWLVSRQMSRTWKVSSVFSDFGASLLALALAEASSRWLGLPAEALAMGSFILRVPGLTLTTAISELAEHELVSGASKLAQGVLTLLALGTAYVLMQECGAIDEISSHFQSDIFSPFDVRVIVGNLLMLASFSIIFEAPREALLGSIACGFAGWWILQQFNNPSLFVGASFLASLVVGMISLVLGRFYRLPSQTFSVPGILALVPGLLALSSFRTMAAGQGAQGTELGVRVALIGIAIAFGLFTSRVLAQRMGLSRAITI